MMWFQLVWLFAPEPPGMYCVPSITSQSVVAPCASMWPKPG